MAHRLVVRTTREDTPAVRGDCMPTVISARGDLGRAVSDVHTPTAWGRQDARESNSTIQHHNRDKDSQARRATMRSQRLLPSMQLMMELCALAENTGLLMWSRSLNTRHAVNGTASVLIKVHPFLTKH